jgi:hypothetical protein
MMLDVKEYRKRKRGNSLRESPLFSSFTKDRIISSYGHRNGS